MNGFEQRARRTAVGQLEARVSHVEVCTEGLAGQLVATREATSVVFGTVDRRIDAVDRRIDGIHADLSRQLAALTADRDARVAAWAALTVWQRLRWLVKGDAH